GVSRQTVTRAVNGLPGISTATKERVLAAAAALDYRPSRFGRGLVSGGAHQLGLLVDDLRNPYSPELAAAVLRLAAARGWNVLLADVGLAGDSDRSVQDLGAQSDVVIGYLGARAPEWIERLGSVPVVELDPHGVPARGAVRLDPTDAVEALADHLVAVGVKHPLVLDAPASAPGEPSTRGALLLDALRRRGYLPEHVHAQAASADAGAAGTTAALERHARLDAVVAFNDVMALGALAACRRAGAEVPDRVRVVGIDGLTLGTLVAPTLTTLAVDLDEVARHAVDLALGMLDGALPRSGPSVERVVRHRLVVRESA
ncbi:LacI family DNA-binding transcriptional regulator, partial [Curtobacterium herbarum]